MKLESLEDEIKYIKLDYQNLNKNLQSKVNEIETSLDFICNNLKAVMELLQLNLRNPYACKYCDGHGYKYLSPISDCGQSNKCENCNGTGKLWI